MGAGPSLLGIPEPTSRHTLLRVSSLSSGISKLSHQEWEIQDSGEFQVILKSPPEKHLPSGIPREGITGVKV
jgi:hypothetical protein